MQLRLIIPALAVIAGLALNQFYPTLVSFLAFAAGTVMKSIGLSYNDGREHRCLEYVKLNAVQGNASDVLFQIDKFGWNEAFLMNVGDAKGEILSKALMEKSPAHVLEIGAYVGYSATRIASGLGERGHVTSVEFSKRNAAIARQMVCVQFM